MTTHLETIVSGVLIMLIAIVVVGALVWFFILAPKAQEDFQVSSSFTQYRAAAQVFRGRMSNYEGLCRDLAVAADVSCKDSVDAYRVVTRLPDDHYYCGDSTGFWGEVVTVTRDSMTCR